MLKADTKMIYVQALIIDAQEKTSARFQLQESFNKDFIQFVTPIKRLFTAPCANKKFFFVN